MREIVEYVLSWMWCSADDAKEAGLTNHGRLFGVPAWVMEEGNIVYGCPKAPFLRLYTDACNWVFDSFSYFISEDSVLVVPLYVGRPIE